MSSLDTAQLHAGFVPDGATHASSVPIYQTSAYCYESAAFAAGVFSGKESGYTYSRIDNPTVAALEARMTAIERGKACVAFASGMAAVVSAVYALCAAGDHIVSIATLYGGTYTLFASRLPQVSNITTTFVAPDDLAGIEAAIRENTKCIYLETLCNPRLNIPDFAGIADIARRHGLPVVLDNTFGIPPIFDARGYADIVVHSLSKYACGHGTTIAGCAVDMGTFDFHSPRFPGMQAPDTQNRSTVYADQPAPVAAKMRSQMIRDFGACLSPFNAFLILQGLETLTLRVRRHNENALAAAKFLANHDKVAYVHYPMLETDEYHARAMQYMPNGAGAIFSFGVKGGVAEGRRFIDGLRLFSLLANVADAKSLVVHPASTTHGQLNERELVAAGVRPELIRLSVGLEDVDDILQDLDSALARV